MNGKLYVTYVNMMCMYLCGLIVKKERDANLHHVHITLKSLICASYKHVLISPNKNHTLKDEIIISAQKRKYKIVKHCKIYLFVLFVTSKSI